ncbi:hypothetical protein PVBG_03321 [Plasmodium vivax Brazil I]|uniref:Uncharacterized protein n=1 Tax=Plasmodium vivax (strain Brazil I) TaxID=1033975 RepID=A0A0J9SSQ1_PLAV1|nr:hypothetical protein PVBG_03321 [Plasmodium vivax Brazil I]
MSDLKNCNLKKKKNYIYFFKIVTVIVLIWMYTPYHYKKDKNSFKKKIFKKYGIRFLLFGLFPLLGLIFPVLFGTFKLADGILPWCGKQEGTHRHNGANSDCELKYYDPQLIRDILEYNSLIFSIISSIIIFVFIYAFIKVIKYERLRARKGKMNRK